MKRSRFVANQGDNREIPCAGSSGKRLFFNTKEACLDDIVDAIIKEHYPELLDADRDTICGREKPASPLGELADLGDEPPPPG